METVEKPAGSDPASLDVLETYLQNFNEELSTTTTPAVGPGGKGGAALQVSGKGPQECQPLPILCFCFGGLRVGKFDSHFLFNVCVFLS